MFVVHLLCGESCTSEDMVVNEIDEDAAVVEATDCRRKRAEARASWGFFPEGLQA